MKSDNLIPCTGGCLQCSPVKPSFVVGGQDGIWASLLEAADEGLQAAHSPSNELGAAKWL